MTKRKKPENESHDEAQERQRLEYISNFSTRSDKTSWNRKLDNMVKLMSQLTPIEDKIMQIMAEEKQPLLDEIQELRLTMIKECVHPFEQLVEHDNHIECKFCTRHFNIVDNG